MPASRLLLPSAHASLSHSFYPHFHLLESRVLTLLHNDMEQSALLLKYTTQHPCNTLWSPSFNQKKIVFLCPQGGAAETDLLSFLPEKKSEKQAALLRLSHLANIWNLLVQRWIQLEIRDQQCFWCWYFVWFLFFLLLWHQFNAQHEFNVEQLHRKMLFKCDASILMSEKSLYTPWDSDFIHSYWK